MRSRIALGALAALALVAGLAALTDREPAPGSPGPQAVERVASELTTRQLAGSRIVCGFDGRTAPQSLLGAISDGEIGGVIYFDDNVRSRAQLARMSAAIQAAPRPDPLKPPVVISVDQEGGQVKRLGGAPNASAEQMGSRGASYSRSQGARTAASLKGVGINVDLAPVLDVARPSGFIADQDRAFGTKPGRVATAGVAFAQGLQSGGVAATAKHFPGLGSTASNTDLRPAKIPLSAGVLRRVDEAPYRAFSAAGGKLVMVSSARYPALRDPVLPASQSPAIVQDELRGTPRLRRRDDHGLARDPFGDPGRLRRPGRDPRRDRRDGPAALRPLRRRDPGGPGAPQRPRRRHHRPRGLRALGRQDPRPAGRPYVVDQSRIVRFGFR